MSGHSRLRHSLRLSIQASPHSEFAQVKPYNITPESGSPGSTTGSLSTDSTASSTGSSTGSEWRICSVLCLHDYTSDDPTHLSFSRNEILEIVQQEDSGWWAALRLPENHVGWISSAFVEPLSFELAERLRNISANLRAQEYEAEQSSFAQVAYSLDPISRFLDPLDNDGHILPNIEKTPATPAVQEQFADPIEDASNDASHLSPVPLSNPHFNLSPTNSESASWSWLPWDTIQAQGRQISPTTPIQHFPRSRSLDKPISPITISMIEQGPPAGEYHARSLSESLPHRHRRRRPLLLDDSSSLSRLSTLIESRDTASIDSLAHNPMESMDAFSRLRSQSPGRAQSPNHGRLSDQTSPMSAGNSPRSPRPNSSWFMRPSYDDDEIKVDYDGTIKAATLSALVERLTLDYLKSSKEDKFRHTFLASFRTFASAEVIFDLIVDRYHLKCPLNLTREETEEWKEKKLRPTRHRVLTIFTMWMEDHNMARQEPHIARRLQEFLASISEGEPLALTAKLMLQALDRLIKISTTTPRLATTPVSTPKRWRHKLTTPDLLRTDIIELARQLCLFEHRLYSKILVQDCWVWTQAKNALFDFCSTHDKLVAWVKKSLSNAEGSRKKADTLDFWINIADKCKSFNNISSMNAIVTALMSEVIRPTDPVWSHVHKKATLDAIVSLRDSNNTFADYKQLHTSIDGPCVPFVGMYLLEIIEVHEDYPDTVHAFNGTPMINFSKRQKWAAIVEEMLRFQSRSYSFAEVSPLMSFIEGNLFNPEQNPRFVHNRSREQLDGRALVSMVVAEMEAAWARK